MPVYATASDYQTWSGAAPPSNIDALLRSASLTIGRLIRTAVYQVDTGGLPTDTATAQALRDATCAQVAHMLATGDTTGTGYVARTEGSIGGLSVRKVLSGAAVTASGQVAAVSPQVVDILLGSPLAFGAVGDTWPAYY